ncbi:mannitol dehydrogenase family protein [Amycolatopsis aidingensis]|uniref:mannitol dehydrogenase family protein n=1 Tax=Amycolatopsis aidingensis TaxID=2842453 RepID=UPI001C0C098D|nr:mannitol dehydrogenase family protein [Amycolatopsis aidingensis]
MTGSVDGSRPAVRIVHLGLGAFHRAHQVWFTERGDPSWGIAAFSGRSTRLAGTLSAQDCVYTLIERGPDTDTFHRMTSLVRAHGADRQPELDRLVAHPDVAVITLTITEAGYLVGPDGAVEPASPLLADIAALRDGGPPRTAPGRLLRALRARREADGGPVAVVSCDNLVANGARAGTALLALAEEADRDLVAWLKDNVSFVDTVSDRITPATTEDDIALVPRATGHTDHAPVVTEPFAEWVLAGELPAGRPEWERAGAVLVDDIRPFERRKLRLLNGAHLLLALEGLRRGHRTVAEAMADPALARLTEEYWSVAATGVPEPDAYLRRLRARFGNSRIRHSLEQIATDAETKLRERIVPVVTELLTSGVDPTPALRVVAAWLTHTGLASDSPGAGTALDRLAPGWANERRLRHRLDLAGAELSGPAPAVGPTEHTEGVTQ